MTKPKKSYRPVVCSMEQIKFFEQRRIEEAMGGPPPGYMEAVTRVLKEYDPDGKKALEIAMKYGKK